MICDKVKLIASSDLTLSMLKLCHQSFALPSSYKPMQNFYGSQNATKTHEMLQIHANMKSTNDENLNIQFVV